ncbi:hypothetical protein [Bradyrhizobium sp. 164]|uniref:hypothetical protein n=1 Tax=Bradyrhizobium sp. 164 TaxID=2782637 RepID=UPI001FF7C21F|nr:hypothetical protein [Bradyrhizobium sp. 164]MCK1595482.1 hypothetical protein [Bradyrhizobium sp. 164]
MSDDRNSIDVARSVSRNWTGEEMTTDAMLDEFQLYGHTKRAGILDQIDSEYEAMQVDGSNLKKFAEYSSFRREMKAVHDALRKAGR